MLPSRTNLGSKIGGCKKIDYTLGILDWKSALQSTGNQYSLNVKNWKSPKMDSTCPFLRLFSVIFFEPGGGAGYCGRRAWTFGKMHPFLINISLGQGIPLGHLFVILRAK